MLGTGPIHTAVDHKDLDHIVPVAASGLPVSVDPNGAASLSRNNTALGPAANQRRKNAIRTLKKCASVDPSLSSLESNAHDPLRQSWSPILPCPA